MILVSLRNRSAERRGRQNALCDKRDRLVIVQKDLFIGGCSSAEKFFNQKLLSRLSHKIYRLLSSTVQLRKLTTITTR